jgi:hypothetical protein
LGELEMKIPVYILSYQRAGMATTPVLMKKMGFDNIYLCVRELEHKLYKTLYPWCNFVKVSDNIGGLANTRQFLLEWITDDFYVMMDDDIRGFSYKPVISKFGGLQPATSAEVKSVFSYMQVAARANDYLFAGSVPDRFTVAHPSNETYKPYGFMRQCLFMGKRLRKHASFNRLKVFLDIDYSLQIAKEGIPMQIARCMCIEAAGDAYTAERGGLGPERAKMLQAAGSQDKYDKRVWAAIQKLHPDVIKLKPRRRIDWSGAYKLGVKKNAFK